jgi:O-antigen/teichoic acid export membrane protein
VLAALVAWNLGNYLFFLAAGRLLGPADFGLAAALLAVTVIVSVPGNALQYGIARSVAAGDRRGAVSSAVYRRAWRLSLVISAATGVAAVAGILVAHAISADVPVGPLIVTVAIVLPMGPLFLSLGQLQGEQRYTAYAVTFSLWGVPRPVLLAVLALAEIGVYAALGATALALLIAASTGAWLTAPRLRGNDPPAGRDWGTFTASLPAVLVGLTGVAFLTNLDVVAAKLALGAHDAGYYGAEAVLGKAVIVVPQALATVLLPRVAARRAEDADTGRMLALAVVTTVLVGGAVALLCIPLADLVTRIAFGGDYVPGAGLLAPLVAASTLLGLAIVLVAHHSARNDHRFLWAVGGVAVLQVALLALFHDSGGEIVAVNVVSGLAVLAIHEVIHGRSADGIGRGLVSLIRSRRR